MHSMILLMANDHVEYIDNISLWKTKVGLSTCFWEYITHFMKYDMKISKYRIMTVGLIYLRYLSSDINSWFFVNSKNNFDFMLLEKGSDIKM